MFDFNKRDAAAKDDDFYPNDEAAMETGSPQPAPARQAATSGRREAAVIGPSIHINGDLRGEEDLIIEGEVKGTVNLKHNALTIGSQGKVTADVYANSINVDGFMEGDLYGAERISIRKTAEVRGNIISPRVSLEDGARFKGSIEMDPESEALQKAFADNRGNGKTTAFPGKQAGSGDSKPAASPESTASSSPDTTAQAAKGGTAG
ncbi:cytoskeletal protein CcmA (bactofilin family) [Methylohalomonas lacus]|uniref:Cytoskeletal protein CcmA (Bactofilin family) n=1 Tax=Methylohalomonas lacus TaxID=398773 RepID=A0AAE3HJQ8_9GAMM|nr:polymer-forming cytoskeletal protein [Methylohalomonas lacus]MCS3903619.1 cytoskeletal protein CcmA (bactofilin family) [Methylohalomonas lacus]